MKNFDKFIYRFHADGAEGGGGGGSSAAAGVSAATQAGAAGASTGAAAASGGASGAGQGGDANAAGAAAAAQAAPFFKGLYGEDGKIDKAAFDRLPEGLKGHKDLFAKYDTVESLLTGFANANSMAVRKALAPLKGDEPADILAERKKQLDTMLNVPADPKGYGIKRPETIPEELWSDDFAGQMAQWGMKNSVSPAAMKEAIGMLSARAQADMAAYQKHDADFFTAQQQTFEQETHKLGLALDKANEMVEAGARTLGVKADSPLLKNAEHRMAMIRMTQLVAEDRLVTGNEGGAAKGGDLIDQARDIARNPENPMYKAYHDPMHPDHDTARSKWNDLYRRAKPRAPVASSSE